MSNLRLLDDPKIEEPLELLTPKPKDRVFSLLQKAFTPIGASAIAGNFDVETGGTFDFGQKQIGGGPGRGLAQFGGKVLKGYDKYLGTEKVSDSAETQIDYIKDILTSDKHYDIGAGNRKKIKKAFESGNINEATTAFSDYFEKPSKPHVERRKTSANTFYDTIKPKEYKIQPGDTLSGIAEKHGTTTEELQKINKIEDPNKIRAGQTLNLSFLTDFLMPSAQAAEQEGGFRGKGASGDWSTLSQKWEGSKVFQTIQGWSDKMAEKYPYWLEERPDYGDQKTTRAAQAVQTAAALGTIGVIGASVIQNISQAVQMNKALKGMENITSNLPKIEKILATKGIKLPENMSSLDKIKTMAGMTRQSPTLGSILKAASMRPAQVPAPYIVGQMVKFGDQIGKITNITGKTAQLLTAAGQTISASLSQLTPKDAPTGQITPKKPIVEPAKETWQMTQEEFKKVPIIKYIEENKKGMKVSERDKLGEQLVDQGLMSIEDFNAMTGQFGFGGGVTGVANITTGKPIPSKPIEGDMGSILNYIGQWQTFTNIPLFAHRTAIRKALSEGKNIPKDILASYIGWGSGTGEERQNEWAADALRKLYPGENTENLIAKGKELGKVSSDLFTVEVPLRMAKSQIIDKEGASNIKEFTNKINEWIDTTGRSSEDDVHKSFARQMVRFAKENNLSPEEFYKMAKGEIEAPSRVRELRTKKEDVEKEMKQLTKPVTGPTEPATEPLIEEARKHKSAEEFVEKQIKQLPDTIRLYRGLNKKFEEGFDTAKTDAPVGYSTHTDNPELARQYAGEEGFVYKIDLPKNKLGKELVDKEGDRVLFVDNEKKAGLEGISGKEYLVYNDHDLYKPEMVSEHKTKSQLTDIWNKAQEKPLDIPKEKGYIIREGKGDYYELSEAERKDLSQQKRVSQSISSSSLKVKYKRQGSFQFPQEKIGSPADVAYAFRELKNEAVERFYVLGIKNGSPISIEPISIGTINAALVSPFEPLNLLITKKADSYYLIHNHPSRNVAISTEDKNITRIFESAYEKHNLKFAGHAIINTTEFGFQYPDGSFETLPMPRELLTPKKVTQYSKYIEWLEGRGTAITSGEDVVKFSKSLNFDKENNALILYLNQGNEILMSDIIPNKKISAKNIAEVAIQNRAIGVILVNSKLENPQIQNLQRDLRPYPIKVLDDVGIKEEGFISKLDQGVIREKPTEYVPKTIGGIVKQSGYIDPNKAKAAGWSSEDIRKLRPFMKIGGQSPDVLAERMSSELMLSPEDTPSEVLKQALYGKQRTIEEVEKKLPKEEKLVKMAPSKIEGAKDLKPFGEMLGKEKVKQTITPILPQGMKSFTNFETKESPIPFYDRVINKINGLRLSGKLTPQEANEQIQECKKNKLEYAREKGIAITKTQSGKTRIAIRKSGFYAKKEIETAPIHDVYSQFQAPSGMALMQDGYKKGDPFGIMYKEVWMPAKKAIADSMDFKNKFDTEFKALLKKHKFPITKKSGLVLSDMLERKIKVPNRHKELLKDIRRYMDNKREIANAVREEMGKTKIGYIENYIPHIQETSIWNELVGNDVTITDNFDFIIPNQVKNPFAFKRLLKEMEKPERNFFSLVERYNSAIAKDMYINPTIENIKAYNTALKDKGLFKASKFWDEYIRTGLLGKQHKIDSALSVSPIVRKGLKKWKDILNKAFLTGKISWNIATQPLSYISLTPAEAGFGNALKAVFKMFNKGIRRSVNEHSVSLKIKSKDVLSDAIGEGRGYANRIYRTKIDKWNDMLSVISSVEEQLLHQASYIAGLDRAKEIGYTGEDAHMFADLCAERTQSMYNKENRALILNSDITTAAVPFQSFATELSNHAKEILTKTKGAMRLNKRQRIGKLIRLLIGIWLANQYAKALTGREKTTVGTFIPFAGETVDRLISKVTKKGYTTTRSPVSVVQQAEGLIKATKDYLKYGDTTRLRKIGITFGPALLGAGGGGQISNLVEGIITNIEGEVKSVSGQTLFDIKDLESQIKASVFGVWSTKGGREYWEKRQGKKEPTKLRLLGESSISIKRLRLLN